MIVKGLDVEKKSGYFFPKSFPYTNSHIFVRVKRVPIRGVTIITANCYSLLNFGILYFSAILTHNLRETRKVFGNFL